MADTIPNNTENQEGAAEVDPWAVAFAALDKENQENAAEASDTGTDQESDNGTDASGASDADTHTGDANTGTGSADNAADDSAALQGAAGGSGDLAGTDAGTDDDDSPSVFGITTEDFESYKESVVSRVEDRVIKDVAAEYIKRGARNTNGKLGATIDDKDICKRDEDGVPHFYNPETGKEFTGDNPRRQAQEWVDDYNRVLKENFNQTCSQYSQTLMEREAPALAVLEFAPTYEKLDPVRQTMLDNLLSDYEIKDSNDEIIGYSCDLNQALNAVNRQVKSIQEMQGAQSLPDKTQEVVNSDGQSGQSPALDLKASATPPASGKPKFNSLEEAMEWEQDQLLAKQKGTK